MADDDKRPMQRTPKGLESYVPSPVLASVKLSAVLRSSAPGSARRHSERGDERDDELLHP
jgi:hypothetical protein